MVVVVTPCQTNNHVNCIHFSPSVTIVIHSILKVLYQDSHSPLPIYMLSVTTLMHESVTKD